MGEEDVSQKTDKKKLKTLCRSSSSEMVGTFVANRGKQNSNESSIKEEENPIDHHHTQQFTSRTSPALI